MKACFKMLIENTLEGQIDKVEIAINRIKMFEPEDGYYLAFSGGKDSIVCYELVKMAGVKFDTHFNFTTVDPPELLKFIRDNYPDVIWDKPKKTMWELIEHAGMPPTRIARYCCEELKERGGVGRFIIIGVRRAESTKRRNRVMVENCTKQNKRLLSPIIDWSDDDVWEFIRLYKLKYCCLYDQGYKRIGCILCPMAGKEGARRDMARYPNYIKAYKKAFRKMLDRKIAKGNDYQAKWKNSADSVFDWWIYKSEKDKKANRLFDDDIFNYE